MNTLGIILIIAAYLAMAGFSAILTRFVLVNGFDITKHDDKMLLSAMTAIAWPAVLPVWAGCYLAKWTIEWLLNHEN